MEDRERQVEKKGLENNQKEEKEEEKETEKERA